MSWDQLENVPSVRQRSCLLTLPTVARTTGKNETSLKDKDVIISLCSVATAKMRSSLNVIKKQMK